eukprot:TRINITY_DN8591_c5_g1_i1.p1 TRINITY_DN8591_c5_g1~~TRINITY_DN8591_c5_g1_i1.p1  ORF type:complete len:1391 (+),score=544.91 TRINITY_DN8591_c5_g1_i1:45-4175(+)
MGGVDDVSPVAAALAAQAPAPVLYHSPGDAWRVGTVLPFDPSGGLAQVQDSENRQLYAVRVGSEIRPLMQPLPDPEDVDELLTLGSQCDDATLLCALRSRYQVGSPYSSIGSDIIVAVNPGRERVEEASADDYLGAEATAGTLKPHPWMVAGRALRHAARGDDAAVVISGEGGAGKTTAAHQIIDALLTRVPQSDSGEGSAVVKVTVDAAEFDDAQFVSDVGEHLSVPPASVDVLSAERRGSQTDVRFRFRKLGDAGERLVGDFAGYQELLPPPLLAKLQLTRAAVEPPPAKLSRAITDIATAFCCAASVLGSDSSQACVVTRLAVSSAGTVVGADLRQYLLDANRVCCPRQSERGFNVFYYMVCGASEVERERYNLGTVEQYAADPPPVLGGPRPIGASLDTEWSPTGWLRERGVFGDAWDGLRMALDVCHVSPRIQDWAWRVLAALVQLCQLSFDSRSRETTVTSESVQNLTQAAELLEVQGERLHGVLTRYLRDASGDGHVESLTPRQAEEARNSLCRVLYQKVVETVFAAVSESFKPAVEVAGWVTVVDALPPLDALGQNDMRSLVLNFGAELLQQHVNREVFQRVVEEWSRDLGAEFPPVVADFDDNTPLVKLLRARGGIFDVIDDESQKADSKDSRLLQMMADAFRKHPRFQRHATPAHSFTLRHSSGEVHYLVPGMTAANRNAVLPEPVRACMARSLCRYTRDCFVTDEERQEYADAAGGVTRPRPPMRAVPERLTLATSVRQQLAQLLALLQPPSGPPPRSLFVRCVRPARVLNRGRDERAVFHGRHVMRQLTSSGLVPILRQLSAHPFPVRLSYADFCGSARLLFDEYERTNPPPEGSDAEPAETDVRTRSADVLHWCGVDAEGFRAGAERLLLTTAAFRRVVTAQAEVLASHAAVVQAWAAGCFAVAVVENETAAAAAEVQRHHQTRQLVRDRAKWEQERNHREAAALRRLVEEEARGRRNTDNLETVDYIAIMTGLIDGVDRVKRAVAAESRRREREQQLALLSMVDEERRLESQRREERLSLRILQQGGKLDRVFAMRHEAEEKALRRRTRVQSQQERALHQRLQMEGGRLETEKRLLAKQLQRDAFVKQKAAERDGLERKKFERAAVDKAAREARLRARQAWEEAKHEEFEMDAVERDVLNRVKVELTQNRKQRSCEEAVQLRMKQQEAQDTLARMERIRARRQLQRERLAAKDQAAVEEERKARERQTWKAQNQQRMLKAEAEKIHEQAERRRFARRQEEKLRLSTPMVWHQMASSDRGSVAGSPRATLGSPRRIRAASASPTASASPFSVASMTRAEAKRLPLYQRIPPPTPFTMSGGRALHARTISPETMAGLRAYHASEPDPPLYSSRSQTPSRTLPIP